MRNHATSPIQAPPEHRPETDVLRSVAGGRDLRAVVTAYETVQRQRVYLGGCIRAGLLGRPEPEMAAPGMTFPEVWPEETGSAEVAATLVAVRKGVADGPVPLVGRAYRAAWNAEIADRREVLARAAAHPAWHWIDALPGAVPILAARLLARLDIHRAPTVSSFWSYCGYATVPAVRWACADCGARFDVPEGGRKPRVHRRPGTGAECIAPLAQDDTASSIRIAQPRDGSPDAGYDPVARKLCDLLGAGLTRERGAYGRHFQSELAMVERDRPGWPYPRRRATAARKTTKLFLRHLWLVWRASAGLPVSRPDPGHDPAELIDPWSVTRQRTVPGKAATDRPVRH